MLLLLPLALFGACAPPPYTADAESTEPSIQITWPPPETSAAGCVIVSVDVQNFRLVDPAVMNGEVVEGEGHYHIVTPAGYDPCFAPYCIADFRSLAADQQGELRALIVDSNHQAVLDEEGDPYEAKILFSFEAAATCEYDASASAMGDTGGHTSSH